MNGLSINSINKIPQRQALERIYESSQSMFRGIVDSVHSRTLDELYKDEFRPQTLNANMTTVKSLTTGEPVPAKVSFYVKEGTLEGSHRRQYVLSSENNKTLGKKSFGIVINGDKKSFTPGFIESYKNNEYAGTQIRLLQIACEFAKNNGLDKMPLIGLFPAIKFHTMMGFRPVVEKSMEVNSIKDLNSSLEMFNQMYSKNISPKDVEPVLSKVDGKLYFDRNRTAFCAVMKKNERMLEQKHQRHLKLSFSDEDNDISMVLEGDEFKKWQNRIKGFEILPDTDSEPKQFTFFQRIANVFGYI